MLGSKEPKVNRPWPVPLRRSWTSGGDQQVSRRCPHLEKRLWRGHSHLQSFLLEIMEDFLKEEALGGRPFPMS